MIPRDDPEMSMVPGQRNASSEVVEAVPKGEELPPARTVDQSHMEKAAQASTAMDALREQLDKAKAFGVMAIGVLVDLAFLIIWVLLHQAAHWAIHLLGDLPGMRQVFLTAMEYLFDVATLALVAAYVLRDVWRSIQRIWRSK